MSDQPQSSTGTEPTPGEIRQPEQKEPAAAKNNTAVMILAFVAVAATGMLIATLGRTSGEKRSDRQASEVKELEAQLKAQRDDLNRKRTQLGLRPIEDGGETIEEITRRIKRDADTMVSLTNSFQSMLAEKDAAISAKNGELIRSEQLRQTLATESSRLQTELAKALLSTSESDRIRQSAESLAAQRDVLVKQIATLRTELAEAKNNTAGEAELSTLRNRAEEAVRAREFFEKRVKELEAELAKTRLFAKSESELFPEALRLFRALRGLEGKADSEINTAYSTLAVDLGTNVMRTVNFATGSSILTPDEQAGLLTTLADVPDGDLVLVVGYASKIGEAEANRILSSDRATAVARYFSDRKRTGQMVQAVYLGQTDRFSSRIPERNQMVEVWRIRKK